jgi:acyl-CoA synthetase (AMP-forming)/AMP-acid ligase II
MSANRGVGYLPGQDERNNLISYFERHLEVCPDRVALRWAEPAAIPAGDGPADAPLPCAQVTYRELEHLIRVTAGGLRELGIARGDRVVLFLPMGVALYTAMFAVQSLGAIAVFLDSWARRDQLGAIVARVRPVAMISHRVAFEHAANVPGLAEIPLRVLAGPGECTGFAARLEDLMAGRERAPLCAVSGDDSALVTFTTGSSGTPKGADRTHRFLAAQHLALHRILPYREGDVDLPAFPIFSLNNLASGVTTLVPAIDLARPSERDAATLAAQMIHERVTCATLSPSNLVQIARWGAEAGLRLPALRRVVTGGAPVGRDDVRAFARIAPNAEILVLYGSTEVEPMAYIEAKEMLARPAPEDEDVVEVGVDVGRMAEGLEWKFLKPVAGPIDLRETPWEALEVPSGEVGELVVAGDHVCGRYYDDEEAMRRAKIRGEDGRVWHRTGDLGRLDEEGHLWIVGRVHNVVRRADRLLFPVPAEMILRRVPGLRRGAFLGCQDERLGERATVAVELEAGASVRAVLAEVRRLFARNDIPLDSFHVVDAIPMDPRHHSKVEYGVLRRRLRAPEDLLAEAVEGRS